MRIIACFALIFFLMLSSSYAATNFQSYRIKTDDGFANIKVNTSSIYAGNTFFVRDDYRTVSNETKFNDLVADKLISREDGQTSFNYRYSWISYKGINNNSLIITVEGNLYAPTGDASDINPETLSFPQNSKFITIGSMDLNKPLQFKVAELNNEFIRLEFVP